MEKQQKSSEDSLETSSFPKQEKETNSSKNISTEKSKENIRGRGRPPGAKNKLTLLQEAAKEGIMTEVLDNFAPIVKATLKRAEEGDPTALKILWDRVIPAQKATDGSNQQSSGGVTIVVQGTSTITPAKDVIDGEIIN